MIGTEAEARRLKRLESIAKAAGRLCAAAAEFLPDYPAALSEHWDVLERALMTLDAAEWLLASKLGDNHPLTHWRCSRCGNVVGCYRKPDYLCETCHPEAYRWPAGAR